MVELVSKAGPETSVEEARRNLDEAIEMVLEGNRLLAEEGAGSPASII